MGDTPYEFVRVENYFGEDREYLKEEKWTSLNKYAATQRNHISVDVGVLPPSPYPARQQPDPMYATDPIRNKYYQVIVAIGEYAVVVNFLMYNTFRVRFDPAVKVKPSTETGKIVVDYPNTNSRAIVQGDVASLRESLNYRPKHPNHMFTMTREDVAGHHRFQTFDPLFNNESTEAFLTMEVYENPFKIVVKNDRNAEVFSTDDIYFRSSGFDGDFQVIQAVKKPPGGKYLGFGEQGGKHLYKNQEQLTYFNYDNMRYKAVYNRGPLETREPLYHSDPFFMELSSSHEESVYGIYIDNPSQICIDIGFLDSQKYLFGTRFGGLDYYFFLGNDVASVTKAFSAIIGRSKIKPRYVLGYHQGCYGYDTQDKVEQAVEGYRAADIPLDGLHVDVDIQHNYQTFTVDRSTFPHPEDMFRRLREKGVKCSTNITPIISNRDPNYPTFSDGLNQIVLPNGVKVPKFVLEKREGDWKDVGDIWQEYHYKDFSNDSRNKVIPGNIIFNNGNEYYVGEVYYGDNADGTPRGTKGHYPNLYNFEVRKWWGRQYQDLFNLGLEFVWQDMTTPAIRPTMGDYKSFPMKLLVNSDWLRYSDKKERPPIPVIRVWNLYSYNLHKATYHGLANLQGRENKRNFIIGRGSFSGMHRYAGLWTGDNASTWDFYRINVSQALALGICGMVINGQDIGGFETDESGGHWVDPELLIRWTSTGAFLPWFRNHYQAKNNVKYFQEPHRFPRTEDQLNYYNVPEQHRYLYRAVLPACKYYIELRYQLIQVFYDAMFENLFNGLPICRAMLLVECKDKTLFHDNLPRLTTQFFVGNDLLIAPVLQPDREYPEHSIYLPWPSSWYLFKNGRSKLDKPVEGGTTVRNFDAKIYEDPNHIPFILPIYVRAGAIILMLEKENWIGEKNSKGQAHPITFNVYPGTNDIRNRDLLSWVKELYPDGLALPQCSDIGGEYHLFLDDGETIGASPGQLPQFRTDPYVSRLAEDKKSLYRHTYVYHKSWDKEKLITFLRLWDRFTPKYETYFYVAILHDANEKNDPLSDVKVNGVEAKRVADRSQLLSDANSWYWDPNNNTSYVKVQDSAKEITVQASYK